jgi:3-deoxy-manno-octulosonate cytidylyltransferase (CMP-KDO synthetase)
VVPAEVKLATTKTMSIEFKVAIPARYASQRLPGKPLRDVAGKPMLQHVYERAIESGAQSVVVATDDARIAACASTFGAQVCMTSDHHVSGSERLAEAVRLLAWQDETIVVNLQGDEPLMPPANIRQAVENLVTHPQASIATLCVPVNKPEELHNPNVVKVVRDHDGFSLYFSRAPIPYQSGDDYRACYRHVGLYAYRVGYLKTFAQTAACDLERIENLEQLRALCCGDRIYVAVAREPPGPGVDTSADLTAVKSLLQQRSYGSQ